MGDEGDFLELIGPDASTNIFSKLEDVSDVARAGCVSRSWHHFVFENDFFKRLCLKRFPELSKYVHAIEVEELIQPKKVGSSYSTVLETSNKYHKVYAMLTRGLSPILREDRVFLKAISATSTDHYPREGIENTLQLRGQNEPIRTSYWSSLGQSDDRVPERLTYKLIPNLCLIAEINIQPFQVYFHRRSPIYSAKSVRFRMGYFKTSNASAFPGDFIEWTYESPAFPMSQDNCLQNFKLPEPVLCIGGIFQIELMGRAQKCEIDGLFYLCVEHVQVVGRILLPGFNVESTDHPRKCLVSYSSPLTDRKGVESTSS